MVKGTSLLLQMTQVQFPAHTHHIQHTQTYSHMHWPVLHRYAYIHTDKFTLTSRQIHSRATHVCVYTYTHTKVGALVSVYGVCMGLRPG